VSIQAAVLVLEQTGEQELQKVELAQEQAQAQVEEKVLRNQVDFPPYKQSKKHKVMR
jgi:hypothetical protein